MNEREKKLISFLGIVALIMVTMYGYNLFKQKYATLTRKAITTEGELTIRKNLVKSAELYSAEREWLEEYGPKANLPGKSTEVAKSELQEYVNREAQNQGLEVRREKFEPEDETGEFYHRAKVRFEVTGEERALYTWLDRLHQPEQFRTFTFLKITTNRKDDSLIDAIVIAELWYKPERPEDLIQDSEDITASIIPS